MSLLEKCPECGTHLSEGKTCQDDFHQMLAWEAEHPSFLEVHHFMVLCFHLQHPSLYSPEGLTYARQLLAEFVEKGVSPAAVRKHIRVQVDSSKREWKIKGTPASFGDYDHPMQWTMTAVDVTAGGTNNYCENVKAWAQSVFEALKTT